MARIFRGAAAVVMLVGAAGPVVAQELSARQRAAVADTIRIQADRLIGTIGNIDRFMELFTTEPDLEYVDNGRIYPNREALAKAASGFFKRVRSTGGRWDPAHVLPLSSSSGAFTGIFRPQMVDAGGVALWTEGKIWTFVYQRRGGKWVIVQAHEINAKPAP